VGPRAGLGGCGNFKVPIKLNSITKTGKMRTGIWWGELKERDHLQDLGVDVKIVLNWNFKKWDEVVWIGLIWLRIETWPAVVNEVINLRVP
jgi:hypothetical protein